MYLMLVDKEVMELNNTITDYKVIAPQLLPYPLSYVDNNLNYIESIRDWLSQRFIYRNLTNYKMLINSLSLEQSKQVQLQSVIKCRALAVTDNYWLKFKSNETFDQYDLHNIQLSETVMDTAILGILSSIQLSDLKANVDLQGTFAKTWIRCDDGLHLYKTDITTDSSVYSELYSQLLINQMNVNNCHYKPVQYKGLSCTDTKCFTNRDTMLVSMKDCTPYLKQHNYKSLQTMFPKEFSKMCLVDYVIGNIDRHEENYGVLVDSVSNEIIKFAPLFDHNISMAKTTELNTQLRTYIYKPTGKPFLQSAIEAFEVLNYDFNLDLSYTPDYVTERIKILKANATTSDLVTDNICKLHGVDPKDKAARLRLSNELSK